jgi:RNA polymerase-binding transcription factor DksA
MNRLTDKQVVILSDLLNGRELALKSSIHEHIERLRESNPEGFSTLAGDPADQADTDLARGNENAAVVREVSELRNIEAQRWRIAKGDPGVCVDCGGPIGFERLRVQPGAARCIRCQEAHEHTHAPESLRWLDESETSL